MYNHLRPAFNGPALIAAADGTDAGTIVSIGGAKGMYVHGSAPFRLKVTGNNTGIGASMATQGSLFVGGFLYGPFYFGGMDSHIHVAGAGGASNVTITLV